MKRVGLGVACCLLITLAGCTTFPVIEANECGNAVVERGEDCDTFVDAKLGKGAICRPPGVVGECHFDCRLNADRTRAVCPTGTGCAADGICRDPTGQFQAPTKLSSDLSSWLGAADFDGDARPDLITTEPADPLQQARFRLHYFDDDAKLVETRTFPRVTTRPIPRLLTDDARYDLVFSNDLIGMVAGREDREWVPATFSSYVLPGERLRAVAVRADGVGQALALAVFSVLDDGPGVYVPSLLNGKLAKLAPITRPLEDMLGPPLAANLIADERSPCSEVVYAFKGEGAFHVLDLCEIGSDIHQAEVQWRASPVEQIVRFPSGVQATAAPLVADVDGDGDADVMVGANRETYVAYNHGGRLDAEATRFQLPIFEDGSMFAMPMPLAAGDLSGDGLADFVQPLGVLVSHKSLVDGRIGYFTSFENRAEPWSTAQVADLNGNGLLDVIAGATGAPGLSFLNGTGGAFQVAARLSTLGPLRFLTTGDFDGDLINDVAFVDAGPAADPDSLAISFGRRDGVPLPATRIAELRGVQQLGAAQQQAVDNLFVSSTESPHGTPLSTFTLFDGNPDRLPFAPYTLVTFSVNGSLEDSRARALTVGGFTAPGANDVVAIGVPCCTLSWQLWLVPDIGGGQQPPRLLQAEIPAGVLPLTLGGDKGGGRLSIAGVAADLEGDGFDEALWLMPEQISEDVSACRLLIYDIDGDADSAALKQSLAFDEPCPGPELTASDLDGDGDLDLLALIGDPLVAPRALRLLFNDGSGRFPESERVVVRADSGHDVRGFSVFPPPKKHERQLRRVAFVTEDGLHVASALDGAHGFDSVRDVASFHDARSLVVTDPNGDGITDIVVADGAGLWLLGAELR